MVGYNSGQRPEEDTGEDARAIYHQMFNRYKRKNRLRQERLLEENKTVRNGKHKIYFATAEHLIGNNHH